MARNNEKVNDVEDLFKREIYEIIQPFRSNQNIFNKAEFEVDTFWDGDRRIVLIRRKEEKNEQV